MDPYSVILYPLMTESASLMVEKENKLVFVVDLKAGKTDVRKAVEQLYEVKVERVNIQITPDGKKKAFVKLHPDYKAADIAIKGFVFRDVGAVGLHFKPRRTRGLLLQGTHQRPK
jgi:large subunit ribosomal protein L23